jgi:hypothetical protein
MAAMKSPSDARNLRSDRVEESVPLSAQKIFNCIIRDIPTIKEFTEIIYEHVSPDDGNLICQSLTATEEVERRAVRFDILLNEYTPESSY